MVYCYHLQLEISVLTSISLLFEVSAHQSKDDTGDQSQSTSDSMDNSLLILAIMTIAFLSVLVAVIAKCMDCYNSEVSSENHPACADKQYKWGGATGYTSANSSDPNAGFTSGDRIEMTPQQSLPYAMIPSSIPSSAGFQGYSLAGHGDNNQAPVAQGYQESAPSNPGFGGSRHYNPAEPQEPPPAYEAAAHSGSFYGNR